MAVFGLLLIATAIFLEGQFALIAASFSAHRGVFDIWVVAVVAFLAAFLADIAFYWLGKRSGAFLLRKRPKLMSKFEGMKTRFEKNERVMLISYRYLLGFRTIAPMFLGMIDMPFRKFLIYSLPGVVVWTAAFSYIGYAFGGFFESHMEEIHHLEKELLIGIGVLILALFIRRIIIKKGLFRKRVLKPEA